MTDQELREKILEIWPAAKTESVEDILDLATRGARPLLGRKVADGNPQSFDCVCANPFHHLCNEELLARGHKPIEVNIYGEPDPEQRVKVAIGLAEAAARRWEETQANGGRPIGWNARYDGDY